MKPSTLSPLKLEIFETLNSNTVTPSSVAPEQATEAQNNVRPSFVKVVQETMAHNPPAESEKERTHNFEVHGKQLLFAKTSLWLIPETNQFRKTLVWILESRWFEIGITIVIFLNTVFLALGDYEIRIDPKKVSKINDIVNIADIVFSSIFIVEFVLKVLAMGFVLGKGTYLRNGWNMVDFVVVITSIINIIPSIPNVSALRPVRAIKPLRTITTIKGVKSLVSLLIDSLPALANVSVFLLFLIIVYSILGVQLFSGAFEYRCRITPEPVNDIWLADPTNLQLCGTTSCPAETYCGSPSNFNLPKNWNEIQIPELVYGIPNFDNMLNATLTVFQSLTTEGWSTNMYMLSHAYSPAIVITYFCSLIVFGAFFAVNLILAVINDSFSKSSPKEQKSFHSQTKNTTEVVKSPTNKITTETDEIQTPGKPQTQTPLGTIAKEDKDKEKDNAGNDGVLLDETIYQGSVFNAIQQFKRLQSIKKSGFSTDRSANDRPILDDKSIIKDQDKSVINVKDQEKNDNPEPTTQVFALDEHINQRTRNNKIYYYAHKIVLSKIFLNTVILLILLNTVVLALYKYPDDADLNSSLETINVALTFIFIGEMLMKLLGLGFNEYSRDRFNLFDAFIVIVSLIEFITDSVLGSTSAIAVITIFRCFRLIRVFKLARSWASFRNLLAVLGRTLKDIKNFTVLVMVFVVIAALLGLELFAYRARQDDGKFPRMNFNTFGDSLITVFALLTGENWNNIMYDHLRTVGQGCIVYFIFVVLLGNYILLKLFLAILINNFEGLKMPSIKPADWSKVMAILRIRKKRKQISSVSAASNMMRSSKNLRITSVTPILVELAPQNDFSFVATPSDSPRKNKSEPSTPKNLSSRRMTVRDDTVLKNIETAKRNSAFEKALVGRAFFLLSSKNIFRRLVARIALHPLFENFILVAIIGSSIILALDSPIEDPSTSYSTTLAILDKVTTCIFAFEMLSKLIVYGLILNGPQSYLRNAWNILDCLVVIISLISLAFDMTDGIQNITILKQLKILRTLRVLRPLRLISRNENLKLVLNSILASIPSLINLTIVCLIFFLLFGVVGVNYFRGQFYYCDMNNIPESFHLLINIEQDCMDYGGDWVNSDTNFDNVLQATLTLFQLATTEGWLDIMYLGVDSIAIDKQPIAEYGKAWSLYFVLFIIVGSFFVLNLFAGVVVDTFNREKDRIGGIGFLTKDQQNWIHMKLAMMNLTPFKHSQLPQNKLAIKLRGITDKKSFEILSIGMVFLNMFVFALHWDRQPSALTTTLNVINYILLAFFIIEAIAKIIGYGKSYFKSGWNLFDFIIIMISIITLIIDKFTPLEGPSLGSSTSVIRTFRVGRVFRLINKAKSLRAIFNTIIITLPALANIGGLLLLVLFIYASLGNSLFAYVRLGDIITDDVNFQTFGQSFLTLFKMSTGESWNFIMDACSNIQQANYACKDIQTYEEFEIYGFNDCGSGPLAVFYFVTFQIIFTFIMLNLFIAVILEAFNESNKNEDAAITDKEYDHFKDVFKRYDVKSRGLIPEVDLEFLLQDLQPPLLDPLWKISSKERSKFIIEAELPAYELPDSKWKYYQFHDILLALSKRIIKQAQNLAELENVPMNILQIKQIEKTRGKHIQKIPNLVRHALSSSEIKAAAILTFWAKKHAEKKAEKAKRRGPPRESTLIRRGQEEDTFLSRTQDRSTKDLDVRESLISPMSRRRNQENRSHKPTIFLHGDMGQDSEIVQLKIPDNSSPEQTLFIRDDSPKQFDRRQEKKRSSIRSPKPTIVIKEGLAQELAKLEVTPVTQVPEKRKTFTMRKGLAQDLETVVLDHKEESMLLRSSREKSADISFRINPQELETNRNSELKPVQRNSLARRRSTANSKVPQ